MYRTASRAGRMIAHDPLGILLPSSASLLLQACAVWATVTAPVGVAIAAWIVWWVLSIPLRQRTLVVAARQLPSVAPPTSRRGVSFLGLHLLVGPVQVAAFVAGAIVGWLPATALAAAGWVTPAALVFAGGIALGGCTGAVARGVLGYAPAEVLFGGHSAVNALAASVQRGPRHLVAAVMLVLLGDLAMLAGALWCGAGALPGYPLGDLALLHRWSELAGGSST